MACSSLEGKCFSEWPDSPVTLKYPPVTSVLNENPVEARANQFNLTSLKCLPANYHQFDKPFLSHTDASDVSIGGVLSQIQDGKECTIAYGSRSLAKFEHNYCVARRELCTLVYFTCHFPVIYLDGSSQSEPTIKHLSEWLQKVARWIEQLRLSQGQGMAWQCRQIVKDLYVLTVGSDIWCSAKSTQSCHASRHIILGFQVMMSPSCKQVTKTWGLFINYMELTSETTWRWSFSVKVLVATRTTCTLLRTIFHHFISKHFVSNFIVFRNERDILNNAVPTCYMPSSQEGSQID